MQTFHHASFVSISTLVEYFDFLILKFAILSIPYNSQLYKCKHFIMLHLSQLALYEICQISGIIYTAQKMKFSSKDFFRKLRIR